MIFKSFYFYTLKIEIGILISILQSFLLDYKIITDLICFKCINIKPDRLLITLYKVFYKL